MNKSIIILAISLLALCASSCRSTKSATKQSTQSTYINPSTAAESANWTTFSSTGKIALGINGSPMSSSMQIKMVKGDIISISLRPLLGIEMAKMYVYDNTALIIDRYHKTFVRADISLLTNGVAVDVLTLQNFLLGKQVTSNFGAVSLNYTTAPDGSITKLTVTPMGISQSIFEVDYANIQETKAGLVAGKTLIATEYSSRELTLDFNYNKMTWDAEVNEVPDIPAGYSELSIRDFAKSLAGGF